MAARTKVLSLNEEWRTKIQTTLLIERLHQHISGKVGMLPTQLKAIEILLKKTAPDLQAIQIGTNADELFKMVVNK